MTEIGTKTETVLCCLCGTSIAPNPSNMCLSCIRSQIDITSEFSKSEIISFCRTCERYLQPPKYWIQCDLESKELLTLCLKKVKGLGKVKLVDASFLWTEPHSRRVKVKITIQKEVFNGTRLQQSFVVEFIIRNQQCESCQKSFTPHHWVASVQVRQKVDHKRTFYYLEQLIIKYKMHHNCINIKERTDGLDFYFNNKSHAQKFKEFVSTITPIKFTVGERLISHDTHNMTYTYKHTFSVEMAPICQGDLVCLPKQFHKSFGGIGPIVLCEKVFSSIIFMDPITLKRGEVTGSVYWRHPFVSMMNSRQLQEYYVIDVDLTGEKSGKFELGDVEITKLDDIGGENNIMVRTHLGNILNPGDTVLGYDITNANFNDLSSNSYREEDFPKVILVKKFFEKKKKNRKWKLKSLDKKSEDKTKNDLTKMDREYEEFLEELEEDKEMRSKIKIYKDSEQKDGEKKEEEEEEEEDAPGIEDDELLDEEEDEEEEIKDVEKEVDEDFEDEEFIEDDQIIEEEK